MRAMIALDGGRTDHDVLAASAFVLAAPRDQVYLLTVVSPSQVAETASGGPAASFYSQPQGTLAGQTLPRTDVPQHAVEDRGQAVQRVHDEAMLYLSSMGKRYLEELEFEGYVELSDDTADTIMKFIDDHDIQGMAMGTSSGRSRLGSALFGGVAEEVVRRAAVPVMVVKQGTLVAEGEAAED